MTKKRIIVAGIATVLVATLLAVFSMKDATKPLDSATQETDPNRTEQTAHKPDIQPSTAPDVSVAQEKIPQAVLKKAHADGTRVYQIDKIQVTITPEGEVFYLPEEI
jgi:hypothetical protein